MKMGTGKGKEKLDKDLKELRQTLETRQNEINSKKEELTRNGEGIAALEKQLKDERGEIEKLNMKHDQLERTRESLKTQHTVAVNQKQKVVDENTDLKATLEDKKDEIKSLGSGKAKLSKQLDSLKAIKVAGDEETKRLQ